MNSEMEYIMSSGRMYAQRAIMMMHIEVAGHGGCRVRSRKG